MFARTLTINGNTDADAAVKSLREDGKGSGIPSETLAEMMGQVEPLLRTMVESGRVVAATGGQFQASKEIKGGEFRIRLRADFGPPRRGFFASLFGKRGG